MWRAFPFLSASLDAPILKTVLWEYLGHVRDLDVLDLSCGARWLSKQLFECGPRVVSVDGSIELIQRAPMFRALSSSPTT